MSSKHSPGPWDCFIWNKSKPDILTIGAKVTFQNGDWDHIATIDASGPTDAIREELQANAKLMAQAPNLLEALDRIGQMATNAMNDEQDADTQRAYRNRIGSIACAAIAKAKGWTE